MVFSRDRPYDRPVAAAVTLFGVDPGTETAVDETCCGLSLGRSKRIPEKDQGKQIETK